jgi:hypothetical protein
MTEQWPPYKVADEQSVHALGVMKINHVRFETTLVFMLAAVANMKQNRAAVFISRTGAVERANLIKVFSTSKRDWPDEAAKGIDHYLKALRALTENRNVLIHGNIVDIWQTKNPSIITMDREGLTSVTQLSISASR